jgi:hypothetical protein
MGAAGEDASSHSQRIGSSVNGLRSWNAGELSELWNRKEQLLLKCIKNCLIDNRRRWFLGESTRIERNCRWRRSLVTLEEAIASGPGTVVSSWWTVYANSLLSAVTPTHYSLQSYPFEPANSAYPRSWCIEVSNDGTKWTTIHERRDRKELQGKKHVPNCSGPCTSHDPLYETIFTDFLIDHGWLYFKASTGRRSLNVNVGL